MRISISSRAQSQIKFNILNLIEVCFRYLSSALKNNSNFSQIFCEYPLNFVSLDSSLGTTAGPISNIQMQRIAYEMGREDIHNPFKIQKNFEGVLVDREKDRFIAKLNRDSSLRGQVNQSNNSSVLDPDTSFNNRYAQKHTPIKQKVRKSVTHVNASLLNSLISSAGKPNQESLASLMNNTEAYAQYFNLSLPPNKILENQQQLQANRLSKNKRAGKINKLDRMIEEQMLLSQQPQYDHTDSRTLLATIEKRDINGDYAGASTSQKKDRFKFSGRQPPGHQSIDAGHLMPYKARLSYASPDEHNNQSMTNISINETPRELKTDSQVGNHLLPSGLRYLLVNNSTSNGTSPPQGMNKESPRDFVNNTRKIFYTEKSIIAKKEETQKLKEYVVMEHERLAEAKRIFMDDKLRFEKYVSEQEIEAAQTKDKAEKAYEKRLKVAEEVRNLQDEIEKIDSEIRQVDEKIDEYQHSKVFVETVINENKLLSEEIRQMLKNYIKQVMANIFRLKNPAQMANSPASSEPPTPATSQANFFITQDGKQGEVKKPPIKTLIIIVINGRTRRFKHPALEEVECLQTGQSGEGEE